MMWKRREFEHEHEIRVVKWVPDLLIVPKAGGLEPDPNRPRVVHVPWSASDHVESIVVSPYAKDWEVDAIRETIARLCPGLERSLTPSTMRAD
jgi:hypothetical protein